MPTPLTDLSKLIRQRMSSDRAGRGKTALIRKHLADIEAAVDAGFTYVQIAEWISPVLVITPQHLSTIVGQVQKRKKKPTPQPEVKGKPILMETEGKKFKFDPLESGKGMM